MEHRLRPHHQHSHTSGGSGGGREDCWSDGATEALVEAWGERYVQLSRGNLRQKDWKDVAGAVNEHLEAVGKPPKTDIQCKNRIDTLKKKYKIEKARAAPSDWAFYSRLDALVGPGSATKSGSTPPPSAAGSVKKPQPPGASAVKPQRHPSLTFIVKHRPPANPSPNPNPNPNSGASSSRSRVNSSPVSSESSRGGSGGQGGKHDDEEKEDVVEGEGSGLLGRGRVALGRRRRWGSLASAEGGGGAGGVAGGVEGAFGELARAIVKFGEIYERVETSKQQQMLELERQRMEFAKELEFQRMQMFMEAQLELEKMKRPKYASNGGKRL